MPRMPPKKQKARKTRRGRNEGSIYQRSSDGLWAGVASLGVNGMKRTRRTVYAKTKLEVAAKLRDLQQKYDAGRLPENESVTLEQWLIRWLDLIATSVESGTLVPYTRHVKRHIAPRIGGYRLSRLRPADVEGLYSRLLKDGISPAMVRKIGTTLSVALNHAVRSQLIPGNPTLGVKRPRAEKPAIEVLDADEATKLVAACRKVRLGALFILILDSGVRPGEALALSWPDVDFAGERISVTKSLEESGRTKPPKTKGGNRQIDLTTSTMAALHAHRKAMLKEGWNVRTGAVFVDADGAVPRPSHLVRRWLHPILEKAGLPLTSVYSLRHTCATLLLSANVHPKIVSERLGHSTITLTLDTYSHCLPGMQSAATDALKKVFG